MKIVDNSVANKKIAEYGDLIITSCDKHFILFCDDNEGMASLVDLETNDVYDSWEENDLKRWAFVGGVINGDYRITKIINKDNIELHYSQ